MSEIIRQVKFERYGVDLQIFDTYKCERDSQGFSTGRYIAGYVFAVNGKLLFEGTTAYRGKDDDELLMFACMTFCCMRLGDTARDYFDNYTPEQIEWSESSECEQLGDDLAMLRDIHHNNPNEYDAARNLMYVELAR